MINDKRYLHMTVERKNKDIQSEWKAMNRVEEKRFAWASFWILIGLTVIVIIEFVVHGVL